MGFIRDYFARRNIKRWFGTYVSPALVKQMLNSGEAPRIGGENRELTALFGSINSYVALAEQLPLAQLPEFMNAYLTTCTDAIQEEGGTLDKYIGDTVVAMFGAPIRLPNHALQACVAALKIQNQIAGLREKFRSEELKWPEIVHGLHVRIGLNSGMAIVGNMGTTTRFNYTMMGDEVNLAARMESGAKSWGVWTLCTGATMHACDRAHQGHVVFRSLGSIVVKGRTNPVELFEPIALSEDVTAELQECVSLFESGFARYVAQDWDGAEALFLRSSKLEPNQPGKSPGVKSNPSLVFIGLCNSLRADPPGPDWNGVFILKQSEQT
jgi:adenylate cyclase